MAVAAALFLATNLFASTLGLGPELTFSDLQPGKATALEKPLHAWTDDGQAVAVLYRFFHNRFEHVLVRAGADGDADLASVVRLPADSWMFDVAPFRGGLMAAWMDAYNMKVARLDRDGNILAPPIDVQVPNMTGSDMRVVCNDQYCLIRAGDRGFLVGENGSVINSYDGFLLTTAAGRDGFFAERCFSRTSNGVWSEYSTCSMQLLGEYGAIVKTIARPWPIHDAIFDGRRYVVLTAADAPGQFEIDTVDPKTADRATAWIGPSAASALVPAESSLRGRLAWNGSMYLIATTLAAAHNLPDWYSKPDWLATMRLTPSFALLDPVPVKIASDVRESSSLTFQNGTRFEVTGTPDGFRIVWNEISDSRVRTHFIRYDGAVVPPDPRGGVLLRDRVSQITRAAAAGRTSILAVWSEDDGVHETLRAARVTRDGLRLDAQPLTLARDPHLLDDQAFAASDGDGFLVIWNERESWSSPGRLAGATIDAGGNVRWLNVRDGAASQPSVNIEFIDGAYRVALVDWGVAEALTISRGGIVLQRDAFDPKLQIPIRTAQLFDGRNMLVLQGWDSLLGATRDVPSGALQTGQIIPATNGKAFDQPALARDGDSVLVFFSSTPGSSRQLMRLSWKGELKALGTNFFSTGSSWKWPAIVRVDDGFYASVIDSRYDFRSSTFREYRIFVPVDSKLMLGFGQLELPPSFFASRFLPGWNGEGLLLYDREVDTASGLTSQAAVRVVHTAPAHRRAVR